MGKYKKKILPILAVSMLIAGYGCSTEEESKPDLGPDGCPSGTFEDVFSKDQMRQYYTCSYGIVDNYLAATFTDVPSPLYYFIDFDDKVESECKGGPVTDSSFQYCPAERTVYIGAKEMWDGYSGPRGDMDMTASLFHEVGHHIQAVANAYAQTQEEQIAKEVQADCVMGDGVRYMNGVGALEYEDDIGDTQSLIEFLADTKSDSEQTHGRVEDRARAFNAGFTDGIAACNQFFKEIWRPVTQN